MSGDDYETTMAALKGIPGNLFARPMELAALAALEWLGFALHDALPTGEGDNAARVWVSIGEAVKVRSQFLLNNEKLVPKPPSSGGNVVP